jgi:hypothetical protein
VRECEPVGALRHLGILPGGRPDLRLGLPRERSDVAPSPQAPQERLQCPCAPDDAVPRQLKASETGFGALRQPGATPRDRVRESSPLRTRDSLEQAMPGLRNLQHDPIPTRSLLELASD